MMFRFAGGVKRFELELTDDEFTGLMEACKVPGIPSQIHAFFSELERSLPDSSPSRPECFGKEFATADATCKACAVNLDCLDASRTVDK